MSEKLINNLLVVHLTETSGKLFRSAFIFRMCFARMHGCNPLNRVPFMYVIIQLLCGTLVVLSFSMPLFRFVLPLLLIFVAFEAECMRGFISLPILCPLRLAFRMFPPSFRGYATLPLVVILYCFVLDSCATTRRACLKTRFSKFA